MKIRTWRNQINVTFDKNTPHYGCVGVKWHGKPHQVLFISPDEEITWYDEKTETSILIGQVPGKK